MNKFSTNITVKELEDILIFARKNNRYVISLHLISTPIFTKKAVSKTKDWYNQNTHIDVTDYESV